MAEATVGAASRSSPGRPSSFKKHGIHKLIVIGLIAHTCVEATVRHAVELGYEVTMVRDATADHSDSEMRAALDVNVPSYASSTATTNQIVEALSSV